jgi:chemotaxis protein CheX
MTTPIADTPLQQIESLTKEAVREVFQSMLSLEVVTEPPLTTLPADPQGEVVGSVGFIGDATGVICLYAGVGVAKKLTGRMLGIPETEVDGGDMVNDAIGELSNMVVGYVKSRMCDGGLPCVITIPSIVRGRQLSVESPTQVARTVLGFRTGEDHLLAEILLKE